MESVFSFQFTKGISALSGEAGNSSSEADLTSLYESVKNLQQSLTKLLDSSSGVTLSENLSRLGALLTNMTQLFKKDFAGL